MAPLVIEKIPSEVEDLGSDVSPYRITSYPADYTLQVLYEKWGNKEIVIPPFQRKYVWKQPRTSRLIESFLLGLPVPGIFLYRREDTQQLLVVDGQQRLKSIFGFFKNQFPDDEESFSLRDVQPHWDGLTFEQLDPPDQIRLRDSVLRATIIQQIDPKDDTSMYHIFERLNTGGMTLTPQEIRNCVHQGPLNDLLFNLNDNSLWRKILDSEQPDNRMRDVELVLRSLALAFSKQNYAKPMKDFLGRFMANRENSREEHLMQFRAAFEKAASGVLGMLGRRPFHIKRGVNAAVCDAVMVAFMLSSYVPPDVSERYRKLLQNPAFISYVSSGTTDEDTVKQRLILTQKSLMAQ